MTRIVKQLRHLRRGDVVLALLPREEAEAYQGAGGNVRRVRRIVARHASTLGSVGIEWWPTAGDTHARLPVEFFDGRVLFAVVAQRQRGAHATVRTVAA